MRQPRVPVRLALVALAALAVAVVVWVRVRGDDQPARGPAAAARFVDAWEAKLRGTYVTELAFSRTKPDGSALKESTRLVQRPPDRLTVGLGAIEGRLNGKIVRCGTDAAGKGACSATADAKPYDDDVGSEMDTLRSYVAGDRPLYAVVDLGKGCYRLELALQLPAPPYGQQALFCFDKATGAQTLAVIEHPDIGITERTEATAVRGSVTDDDLKLTDDRGAPVVANGVTTTTSS